MTRGLKIEDDTKDKNEPNRLSLKGTNETNNMYEKESEIRKWNDRIFKDLCKFNE